MSYTTIFKVPEKGEIEVAAEIHNAWRGAMNIWIELYKQYLIPKGAIYRDDMIGGKVMMNPQPIWDLRLRDDVHESHKIVLLTTFDNVMVKRVNIAKVIEAMAQWTLDLGSLREQMKVLDKLLDDPTCFAVCWRQTSVTDAWVIYEDDDFRLYDLSRDTGHWFLFDHPCLNVLISQIKNDASEKAKRDDVTTWEHLNVKGLWPRVRKQ